MKFFWPKYPAFLKLLYPERISRINEPDSIYLTFDDGPVPEVTPWILDELKKFDAKASFFCIGENVKKHPEIFKRIIREGHSIGNHTHNHLNGWKTSASNYLENIRAAEEMMSVTREVMSEKGKGNKKEPATLNPELSTPNFSLFRPPFGKIKNSQARMAIDGGYKIVMWDVLSGDYDRKLTHAECFSNVIDNAVEGSTIVFHDSKKACGNLREILPQVLNYYKERGYKFRSIKYAP